MKKPFSTTIEESIQNDFKAACASNNNIPMSTVLEIFMKAYSQGRFRIEMKYESSIDN